jgi:hypothetical protein
VLIALSVAACRRVRSTTDVQASAALICRLALRRKAPPWACHGGPAHSAAEAGSGGGCYGCSPRDAGRSWVAKQYRLLCKAAVSVFTRTGVVATCNNRRQIIRDRCEWHACGTASEDDRRIPWRRWLGLDRRVRPALG